jgi:sugar (pentulose or hexulose) kinase
MESIAYEIRLNIEYIEKSGISVSRIVLSGGATQNAVLCQIVSDVLQKPVQIFAETESSTWGLYCLVRNQLDQDSSIEDIHKSLSLGIESLAPNIGNKGIYDEIYGRFLELGDALSNLIH